MRGQTPDEHDPLQNHQHERIIPHKYHSSTIPIIYPQEIPNVRIPTPAQKPESQTQTLEPEPDTNTDHTPQPSTPIKHAGSEYPGVF